MTPPRLGRRHAVLALCVLAMFLAYTDRVNLAVASVAMRADYGWTQTVKGLVLSAFFLGYLLFQVPSGALARRFGGKRVLAAAVAWWSLFTVLTPYAASLSIGALLAARVCLGLGEAAVMPATYELFSRWVPRGERSGAIGRFLGGIPLGQIVGFSTTGWLTARFGWPASFYLFGALGLAWCGYWLASVRNDPADDQRVGAPERALLDGEARPSTTAAEAGTPWRRLLRESSVWALVAAHFSHNWALYILVSWLPSYFHESLGLSIAGAGLYAAAPWVANFLALVVAGTLADRAIARGVRTIVVRKLCTSGGLVVATACLLLVRGVTSPEVALVLVCATAGAIGVAASGFTSVPLDIAPRHAPVLIGFSNTIATLPGLAGVTVTGWLVETTHTYAAAFLVTAVVTIGGALAFLGLAKARELPG